LRLREESISEVQGLGRRRWADERACSCGLTCAAAVMPAAAARCRCSTLPRLGVLPQLGRRGAISAPLRAVAAFPVWCHRGGEIAPRAAVAGAVVGRARRAELVVSRVGALFLLLLYCQLLFFQLRTHTRLFAGDDRASTLPVSWTLLGLVLIAAALTVLSDRLVANIDGFCKEYHLGQAFVGVVVLPLMGIAVELISSVSVAVKDKMDLALGAWPVL